MKRMIIIALLLIISEHAHGQSLSAVMRRAGTLLTVQEILGLQHYWNPIETLSTNDQVGNLYATLQGGLVAETTNGWNMGTGDTVYAQLSGPISNGVNYTVCVWIKPNITAMNLNGANGGGWMVSDRGNAAGIDFQCNYYIPSAGAKVYAFNIYSNATFSGYATSTNITHDTWQHVAGVCSWDTAEVLIYVNGIRGTNGALAKMPSNVSTTNATIGTASWNPESGLTKYHGSISKVQFYNRALSQSEIQQLVDEGHD